MSIHSKLLVALILTQIFCYPAEGKKPLSISPELPAANMLPPLFGLRNRNETVPA
jgi:hypothetical protein